MTSLSAARSNGQPDSSIARTVSSLFGVAAASSPRKDIPRRQREVEETTLELDQPAAVQPESSTSKGTGPYGPDSRNRRGSPTRIAGRSASTLAAVPPEQRAPSRRFRPVQVRDRRFIHIFLLTAATRAPTGQMLIDFVREGSDGVFVLSPGVAYRESAHVGEGALHRCARAWPEASLHADRPWGRAFWHRAARSGRRSPTAWLGCWRKPMTAIGGASDIERRARSGVLPDPDRRASGRSARAPSPPTAATARPLSTTLYTNSAPVVGEGDRAYLPIVRVGTDSQVAAGR